MEHFDERVAAAKVVCDALEAVGSDARSVRLDTVAKNDIAYFNRTGLYEQVCVTAKSIFGGDYDAGRMAARERIAADLLAALPGFVTHRARNSLNVSGWIDGVSVTVLLGTVVS